MKPADAAAAHTARNADGSWRAPHDLSAHLRAVAALAAQGAHGYGAEWARLAGLWHDLGKYRPGFQRYLRAASGAEAENAHIEGGAGRVSHSTAGALLACARFGSAGRALAYLIAGHHAGLYDWNSDASSLEARLASAASRTELDEALAAAPGRNSARCAPPSTPTWPGSPRRRSRIPVFQALPGLDSIGQAAHGLDCVTVNEHNPMMTTTTGREVPSMEINAAEFKAKCLKLLDEVAATHKPLVAETGE